MGTWGSRNFENDEALDFAATITEKKVSVSELYSTIKAIAAIQDKEDSDYGPDAYDSTKAIVAIELFAALKGNPSQDFPAFAKNWLAKNSVLKIEDVADQSKKAIHQIKDNSELKELWEESGEFDEWADVLHDLEKRISK